MKYLLSFLFLFITSVNSFANNYDEEVKNYAQSVANSSIAKVFNKNLSKEKRFIPFKQAIYDNFDFDFIGKFAIGIYGRGISNEKLNEFISVFRELNIYTYFKKFSLYSDAEIKVVKVEKGKKEGQFFVSSKVTGDLADREYSVDWRIVKKSDKNYKVIDVVIEGVSMAMSFKNEYANILKDAKTNPAIDTLIKEINKKLLNLKN